MSDPGTTAAPIPAPPPAAKRKLTWLWILLGALALLVALAGVLIFVLVRAVVGPVNATNDFLADVKAQHFDAAYGALCKDVKQSTTAAQFATQQRGINRTAGPIRSYDINSSNVTNGRAVTKGTLERARKTFQLQVTLRKEDGDWKVCSAN